MSRNIYIMNLEHDLALANGNSNYIAPKAAQELNRDLTSLFDWYVPCNSIILLNKASQRYQSINTTLSQIKTENYIEEKEDVLHVWGWDEAIIKKLKTIKKDYQWPNIRKISELSHRRQTLKLLRKLTEYGLFDEEKIPSEVFTFEAVEEQTKAKKVVLKAPISGSGRGLWWARNGYDFNVQRWSKRCLDTQGSIMIEPEWEKDNDYATEFEITHHKAQFIGFSHFKTDGPGVYRCNLLESNQAIKKRIEKEIGEGKIDRIIKIQEQFINEEIAPYYDGYLGIDMLTAKGEIDPCVEINLRMTMGLASRLIYDQHINDTSKGEFRIIHYKNKGELSQHAKEMAEKNPIDFKDGKIIKGYQLLTTAQEETLFGIEVEVW